MKFQGQLVDATFVRRYKRFFADFELSDGSIVTAHCANPGAMKTCLLPGAPAWLSCAQNAKRRLQYTWEVVDYNGVRIFVNPARANDVVLAGIRSGIVSELCDYSVIEREVLISERSRIDFVLRGPARTCYVEVKNVTMGVGAGQAAFPDAVTKRGTKHLRDLQALAERGERALLFYCVARNDATSVLPADDIDPEYGAALRQAVGGGVEVLAYRCRITRDGVELSERVPVVIPIGLA